MKIKQYIATAILLIPVVVFAGTVTTESDSVKEAIVKGDAPNTWRITTPEPIKVTTFVSEISKISGKTFVVDPSIDGSISIVAQEPLTKRGIMQLLLSVLSVHHYRVIKTSIGYKVVKEGDDEGSLQFDSNGTSTGDFITTQVIPVRRAVATSLVPILRPLIPKYGQIAAVPEMNALIVSDHAQNIKELRKLIDKLDTVNNQIIRVVSLKNAWASDMVALLKNLNGGTGAGGKNSPSSEIQVISDERTNRLILKGSNDAVTRAMAVIEQLDVTATKNNSLHVIPLRYADAKTTADLLSSVLDTTDKKGKQQGNTVIKADEGMNQLVISAAPTVLAEIDPIIEQLDVPRAQVLVEAVIAEVNMDDKNAYSFQMLLGDTAGSSIPAAGTNFSTGGSSVSSLASNGVGSLSTGVTVGGLLRNGGFNIAGILQAIQSNSAVNLLSTPKVLTMDNEKAEILVGETRPFETGSYTGAGSNTNPFTTVERKDIGLSLDVTPHINANNEVRIDVKATVEAASDETSSLGVITTKRSITSTIRSANNQIMVLGGLIRDDKKQVKQKVPVLGDLPLLGALFRSSTVETTKQNLIMFIKPTILEDKSRVAAASNSAYRAFKSFEMMLPKDLDVRPTSLNDLVE